MHMIETPIADFLTFETSNLDETFKKETLRDFWICCVSREASILGRKEVLTGKAKFGIVGDGKEVPLVAMARAFKKGDWRSGYYRDQTLVFALGLLTVEEYFAQIYADAENDQMTGGRQMNSHFSTPTVDENGEWLHLKETYNISVDISSTAGQMARAVGLTLLLKNSENFLNFLKRPPSVRMVMKSASAISEMPVLRKAFFGNRSTLPAFSRSHCLFLSGMTATASRFRKNTRPRKTASPKFWKDSNRKKEMKPEWKSTWKNAGITSACWNATSKRPNYAEPGTGLS